MSAATYMNAVYALLVRDIRSGVDRARLDAVMAGEEIPMVAVEHQTSVPIDPATGEPDRDSWVMTPQDTGMITQYAKRSSRG